MNETKQNESELVQTRASAISFATSTKFDEAEDGTDDDDEQDPLIPKDRKMEIIKRVTTRFRNEIANQLIRDPKVKEAFGDTGTRPWISDLLGLTPKDWDELIAKEPRDRAKSTYHRPSTYDYCIVFEAGEKGKPCDEGCEHSHCEPRCKDEWEHFGKMTYRTLQRVKDAHLLVEIYKNKKCTKIFALIAINDHWCRRWADVKDADLLIDADGAIAEGRRLKFNLAMCTPMRDENLQNKTTLKMFLAGVEANVGKEEAEVLSGYNPPGLSMNNWQYIYCQFHEDANRSIYVHYDRISGQKVSDVPEVSTGFMRQESDEEATPNAMEGRFSIFDEKCRLRLMYEAIITEHDEGGAGLHIEDLLEEEFHPMAAIFPLHRPEKLELMTDIWLGHSWCGYLLSPRQWCQWRSDSNLEMIRSYFGEPVGFYFAFLNHYLLWLTPIGLLGLAYQIAQFTASKVDIASIEYFVIIIILWSTAFVDFWKRQEATLVCKWGMSKYADKTTPRPDFSKSKDIVEIVDEVTGEFEDYFPVWTKRKRQCCSMCFVVAYIVVMLMTLFVVLGLRQASSTYVGGGLGTPIDTVLQAFPTASYGGHGVIMAKLKSPDKNAAAFIKKMETTEFQIAYPTDPFSAGSLFNAKASVACVDNMQNFYKVACGALDPAKYGTPVQQKDLTTSKGSAAAKSRSQALRAECITDLMGLSVEFVDSSGNKRGLYQNVGTKAEPRYVLYCTPVVAAMTGIGVAVLNSFQIITFNVIYGVAAIWFNEWETHRTDQEFDDALILKSFGFKFINSFTSLFYLAFVQKHIDNLPPDMILKNLQVQLGSLYISMIVVQNSTELLLGPIGEYLKMSAEGVDADEYKNMSPGERQYLLEDYPDTIEDMSELVIQYGFVTLFVVAFPMSPFLALINNIVEVRVDGLKLAYQVRRPFPFGASGLGSWVDILEFFSVIAVISNLGLYVYATPRAEEIFGVEWKNTVFMISTAVTLIFIYFIKVAIPDVPQHWSDHLRRQENIEKNLVLHARTDDDDFDEKDQRRATQTSRVFYFAEGDNNNIGTTIQDYYEDITSKIEPEALAG